jgi:hypothetical protein
LIDALLNEFFLVVRLKKIATLILENDGFYDQQIRDFGGNYFHFLRV